MELFVVVYAKQIGQMIEFRNRLHSGNDGLATCGVSVEKYEPDYGEVCNAVYCSYMKNCPDIRM